MSSNDVLTRNTSGLLAHAQHKSRHALERVCTCLEQMQAEGKAVNFHAVAQTARVTKSYLYTHPELRARIEALRQQQTSVPSQPRSTSQEVSRTQRSKDILLEAKNRRIQELEVEVKRLKEQVKVLYGKLYEQV